LGIRRAWGEVVSIHLDLVHAGVLFREVFHQHAVQPLKLILEGELDAGFVTLHED
jgi:hypothetical protein